MMRLYRLLPFPCFLAVAFGLPAQQMPYFNQYQWMPGLFNPAALGIGGQGQIVAVHRQQFQQLAADIRPNTYLLHADVSNLLPERIGVALQASTDKVHLLRQTQASGFFAYRLMNTDRWRLALGIGASVRSYRFDLNANRLGDPVDLSLFQGRVHRFRFDGGPGVSVERRLGNGSFLAFDASAAQLFTSDLDLADDGSSVLEYRTGAHVLANVRYRYQQRSWALEPALMARITRGSMKGAFDVNVNAYFLPEDRLMVGAGVRSDGGGARMQAGVSFFSVLRLTACAEFHRALGATYEVSASVALLRLSARPRLEDLPLPLPAPVNLVRGEQEAVQALAQAFDLSAGLLRQRQESLSALLDQAEADPSPQKQATAADSCVLLLAQGEAELQQMRQTLQALTSRKLQAKHTVRQATESGAVVSDETRATLRDIEERVAEVNSRAEALGAEHRLLAERCAAVRSQRNEATCIRIGDGECVQALFIQALRRTPGLPAYMFPLRTFAFPGAAAITYHFPDDDEDYALTSEKTVLARHIAEQIQRMQQQGVLLENITLITELQEDRSTLTYEPGVSYDGFLGSESLTYSLADNETAAVLTQTLTLPPDASLNLETLAALKLAAWKTFLTRQGIPAGRIQLQVRYNHSDNSYREETKVVVKLRS
ncbi:MAG: PorP/SprF family type IX secretion system membrane protein [Saprospiraceae bacterium]|nr:PorP/SprF family type IX secretion system membrane protein [Saprospiraceae bacterium]MDW8228722.1 PorP/SprF family type IX secretion system membrane protein [Saprospiraceae bacterium]